MLIFVLSFKSEKELQLKVNQLISLKSKKIKFAAKCSSHYFTAIIYNTLLQISFVIVMQLWMWIILDKPDYTIDFLSLLFNKIL